ncbi:hypothetical protein BVY04_00770 [bacterium M21]|nr:hypothetical protein BVY04_00770 [bacterium M21]
MTRKDLVSSSEVRWCPGCGDYAILNSIQNVLPKLGLPREKYVFVSGIGCSSRLPYYMNTYGFHTIHGRAPAIATGIKVANPDLSVWVITGDGDGLSIGGNHFIHALRRNVNINVLLLNNRIYGLTKGQYSPTSEQGKKTKTSPYGSLEHPINPVCMALASESTFVARTVDSNPAHMKEVFEAAARHEGVSFVEIFQNCVIFNDKAFDNVAKRNVRDERLLKLEDQKPLLFGESQNKGISLKGGKSNVIVLGENGAVLEDVHVHDAHNQDPSYAYRLSQMDYPEHPIPIGIFRQVQAETYENQVVEQVKEATNIQGRRNLQALLRGDDYWEVADEGETISKSSAGGTKLGDEGKIMEERITELLKTKDEPLTQALQEPVGKIFQNYGRLRTKSISPTDSISKAIGLFKAHKLECLLVIKKSKLVGFVTQRDIIMRVVLTSIDRDTTPVSVIMVNSYDALSENNTVGDAINVVSTSGHRYLPLKLKNRRYGIVTVRQILWFIHAKIMGQDTPDEPEQ